MPRYRVLDLRTDDVPADTEVSGVRTPEEAGRKVLGVEVRRSGNSRNLVAKVYFEQDGRTSMVRLYRFAD